KDCGYWGNLPPKPFPSSENAERAEARAPPAPELVAWNRLQVVQRLPDRLSEKPGGRIRIVLGTSRRLGHDPVDNSEVEAVRGVGLERCCSFPLLVGVAPQNRSAALGRDHRVDRVLLHEHAIRDRD